VTSTPTPVAGLTTRPATGTKHGTLSCGKYRKCKRPECVEAVNAYRRRARRLQGYGIWQPLVDAAPAREHLRYLNRLGYSYRSIATALGKPTSSITKVVYPSPARDVRRRIRPELAQAIYALRPEGIQAKLVLAVGTSRRLHALNAIGWPNTVIGERIGSFNTQVLHTHRQKWVLQKTATAVLRCYEELRHLDPVQHGVPAALVKGLHTRAAQHGWRDPLWWEDYGRIDDPEFDPATAERRLSRNELGAIRREEIAHLGSFGLSEDEIGNRVGLSAKHVREVLRELRTGERRDRGTAA